MSVSKNIIQTSRSVAPYSDHLMSCLRLTACLYYIDVMPRRTEEGGESQSPPPLWYIFDLDAPDVMSFIDIQHIFPVYLVFGYTGQSIFLFPNSFIPSQ